MFFECILKQRELPVATDFERQILVVEFIDLFQIVFYCGRRLTVVDLSLSRRDIWQHEDERQRQEPQGAAGRGWHLKISLWSVAWGGRLCALRGIVIVRAKPDASGRAEPCLTSGRRSRSDKR